nr:hypothetical protein [Tanacetum cinerariifolium]
MGAPPSPDYIPGPEAPPSPNYIPGPNYPEYLPPANDMLPAEEQPLPAAVSPTAKSPGYTTESEPEMEPEENDGDDEKSEGDSIDYPTSGGNNDANDDATPPPFGYRVAARISVQPHIFMPFRSDESIPEADISLRKRARFTTPTSRYEIGESSVAAAAARQI